MKISEKIVTKFQEGGAMPPDPAMAAPQEGAPQGGDPAQGGGEDPLAQLAQVAMQALQTQDCQAALAVCEGFISLIEGAQGGGEAPAPESAPVYKKGGVLVKRIKN